MKEVIMKTTICGAALLLSLTMASCEVYESPEINQGLNEENNTSLYTDAYDPISNVGQYYMPEMKVKPKKYCNPRTFSVCPSSLRLPTVTTSTQFQYFFGFTFISGI